MNILIVLVLLVAICCLLTALTLVLRVGAIPEQPREAPTVVILLNEGGVSQRTEQRTHVVVLSRREDSLVHQREPVLPALCNTHSAIPYTYTERIALQQYQTSRSVLSPHLLASG